MRLMALWGESRGARTLVGEMFSDTYSADSKEWNRHESER